MHHLKTLKKKLRGSDEAKDAAYAAIGGLKKAVDAFNSVAGNLGVPGLQMGVGALSTVLGMIQVCAAYLTVDGSLISEPEIAREHGKHRRSGQESRRSDDDGEGVRGAPWPEYISPDAGQTRSLASVSMLPVTCALELLTSRSSCTEINVDAQALKSRNRVLRALNSSENAEKITDFVEKLSSSIQTSMVRKVCCLLPSLLADTPLEIVVRRCACDRVYRERM